MTFKLTRLPEVHEGFKFPEGMAEWRTTDKVPSCDSCFPTLFYSHKMRSA